MKYAVIFDKAENNYSAYVPDLPGCATTGKTLDEARRFIREVVEFRIEGMREDGQRIPAPSSECDYIQAPAAQPIAS